MRIEVMQPGDKVINVTTEFVAVQRKNKEVDIIPFLKDDCGWHVDTENVVTIGYGDNVVVMQNEGVTITNF